MTQSDLRLTDEAIDAIGNLSLKRRIGDDLGTLLFETNRGNAWFGGDGYDGDLLIGDGTTTYNEGLGDAGPTPRIHLDGGHTYNSADIEHTRAYLGGRHANFKLGGDGEDGDIEIEGRPSDGSTSATFPRLYLDGNTTPSAYLKPKLLTEIRAYMSGRYGNLTLGGGDGRNHEDGDLVLRGGRTVKKGELWREMGFEAWQDFESDTDASTHSEHDPEYTYQVVPLPEVQYETKLLEFDDGAASDGGDAKIQRLLSIDPASISDLTATAETTAALPQELETLVRPVENEIKIADQQFGTSWSPILPGDGSDQPATPEDGIPIPSTDGPSPIDPIDTEPVDPNTGPIPIDLGVKGDMLPPPGYLPGEDVADAIDVVEGREDAEREAQEDVEIPTPRIHLDAGGGPRDIDHLRAYLSGETAELLLGGDERAGRLRLRDGSGTETVRADASGRIEVGGGGQPAPQRAPEEDPAEGNITAAELFWNATSSIWNNASDEILVFDENGTEVLREPYPDPAGATRSVPLSVVEINADPAGADSDNLVEEYVVFEHTGVTPLDISGWRVEDAAAHDYTVPDDVVLAPGARVTLRTGAGDDVLTRAVEESTLTPIGPQPGDGTLVLKAAGGATAGYVRGAADGLSVSPAANGGPELSWNTDSGVIAIRNSNGEETFSVDVETGDCTVAGNLSVGGAVREV